jgi:dehydrogenase/reductase SDR family protein 4
MCVLGAFPFCCSISSSKHRLLVCSSPIPQTDEEAWDKIFEINVKAAFLLAKEAMPHLRQTKGYV